jgi:hypothetical protein
MTFPAGATAGQVLVPPASVAGDASWFASAAPASVGPESGVGPASLDPASGAVPSFAPASLGHTPQSTGHELHVSRGLGGDARLLGSDLLGQWDEYAWPGNVRELRNAVARRLALGDLTLAPSVPPPEVPEDGSGAADLVNAILAKDLPLIAARQKLVAEFERQYVERLLARNGGNVTRAAESSGVALRHFQRLRARSKK